MPFSLVTSFSYWLILVCLITGLGYAVILYFRNKHNGFNKYLTVFLFLLRSLSVFVIAFLLLSPLIRNTIRHVEKPVIAIGLDQSESIMIGKDSAQYRDFLIPELNGLSKSLSSKFEVVQYGFSDKTQTGFSSGFNGKHTDISQFLRDMRTRYANRNLAAVILATDGIITRGIDPVFSPDKEDLNIYTIALGDTAQQKDILIARLNFNKIAYLGNTFPVEITISAHSCSGSAGKVEIFSGEQLLFSRDFNVVTDHQTWTIPVSLTASKIGLQQFRARVSTVRNEISYANNTRDFFIEVLDGRQKILLLSAAPHPDISALRSAIEKNQNYELDEYPLNEFNGRIELYNLVILHQLPSVNDAATLILSRIKELNIPVMYIIGNQSNITAFNALQEGMTIPGGTSSFSSAYPLLNDDFSKFSVSRDIESIIAEYPPISVPFGQYTATPSSDVLLYQKIGSIATKMPLVVFNQGVDRRTAIIAGEGIWRWRLTNFLKAGNHEAFDDLLFKMIQYLAVKADQSKFRVFHKSQFTENEDVDFEAELYNDSYELINEPDVSVLITDKNGKSFPFNLTRTKTAYFLNAGSFPPGEYSYKASAVVSGLPYQKTGVFIISAINDEMIHTVADHTLLYTLAAQHNGKMVQPDDLKSLGKILLDRNDFTSVSFVQKKYTDLVSVFLVFLLILALLATEWFLRKRSGGY